MAEGRRPRRKPPPPATADPVESSSPPTAAEQVGSLVVSELLDLARLARTTEGRVQGVEPIDELPADERLAVEDREQDIRLKKTYARWLLGAMIGQLAIADGVFVIYAAAGVHWKLSATVINAWLGSTLVEVIGIVLVVTRYLFPRRDLQE